MRRMIVAAALVLAISAIYFFVSRQEGGSTPPAPASRGETAPDFTLPDRAGKPVSLSQYRGKVVMLTFWASWCPPCRAEMPSMERLHRKMKDRDFVLLAVNVEENGREAVGAFTSEVPASFPILLDETQQVAALYKVRGIPQTFIIDRKGRIVEQVSGAREWDSRAEIARFSALAKEGK